MKTTTYPSKTLPGLEYVSCNSTGKRFLEVKYRGKSVLSSPRCVKVKPCITLLEQVIPQFEPTMAAASHGMEYDRERAFELRSKLLEVFSRYAA